MTDRKLDKRTKWSLIVFLVILVIVGAVARLERNWLTENSLLTQSTTMQLSSSTFTHQGTVPPQYTCDGQDMSPPLAWSGAPAGTQSFVLVVRDPDAPAKAEWIHWVVKNIPATVAAVAENTVPAGGIEVANDFGRVAWGGPCPPDGQHRYFFEVYALDVAEVAGDTLPAIEAAMEGHVLDKAELMATYRRSGS